MQTEFENQFDFYFDDCRWHLVILDADGNVAEDFILGD